MTGLRPDDDPDRDEVNRALEHLLISSPDGPDESAAVRESVSGDDGHPTGLEAITLQLSAAIDALEVGASLRVDWAAFEDCTDHRRHSRLIDVRRSADHFRVETPGDARLADPDRLTTDQRTRLEALGFEGPDDDEIHHAGFPAGGSSNDVAGLVITTMLEVHGGQNLGRLGIIAPGEAIGLLMPPSARRTGPGAAQLVLPRHCSGALWFGYWDTVLAFTVTCPACAWEGAAYDHLTRHGHIDVMSCPECARILAIRELRGVAEIHWASPPGTLGDPSESMAAFNREAADRRDRFRTLLHSAEQLPDIDTDGDVVVSWDLDLSDPEHPVQILWHGDEVLWREAALEANYERFRVVFPILHHRYGARFAGLVPTPSAARWLATGRSDAEARIRRLNAKLRRSSAKRMRR